MTVKSPSLKVPLLESLDNYFEGRQHLILWMSMIFTFFLGLLLFEPKVSIGGDDSIYINRAFNFIKKDAFPTFQGPLYPMILGLIIQVAGMKLLAFKFFSFLCLLGHQWFTYKLFKNYLSPFTLFVFSYLISTSAAILYYGSATYNESFYLFLQSVFLYHFVKSFISNTDNSFNLKKDTKKIIVSGFLLFLLAITKNIGLVAAIAVLLYLVLVKNWKTALLIPASFAVFMSVFKVIKNTFWDIRESQISGQLNALLVKVPYKAESGTEDAFGFLMRFLENSWVYLGYHFINIFGMAPQEYIQESTVATILIYVIFIVGFIVLFKRSRFWLFIGIFIVTSFGVTFLILQTYWIQERLIVVFTPVLLAYLLHVLYHFFSDKFKKYALVLVIGLGFIVAANLVRTFPKIQEQIKVNSNYISGDIYYGFPEDWIYYLKMTSWVAENLPQDAYVACRKPGMAFVYSGGKDFFGIWNIPSDDPEVLYNRLKNAGVTHVIMASLRTNPDDPNTRIINTVRRYLGAINDEFPGKLKVVHQIGESWPTYLYELH